jgi:ribonuclease-3
LNVVTHSADAEALLGYRFGDRSLLELALTPPSSGHPTHNQRLEFLGDALLNAAVAVLLHREWPSWPEGDLSKLRGMLVRREALLDWALDLQLALRSGPRSAKNPAQAGTEKALADALEAVLGALFLDAQSTGGDAFQSVVAVVEQRFLATIQQAWPGIWEVQDSKTTLQERAASHGLEPPVYALLGRRGPDHAPRFKIRVDVGGLCAEAESGSIKGAETEAARILLAKQIWGNSPPLSSRGKLG